MKNRIELYNKFLSDELQGEELKEFVQTIQYNEDLRADFYSYKEAMEDEFSHQYIEYSQPVPVPDLSFITNQEDSDVGSDIGSAFPDEDSINNGTASSDESGEPRPTPSRRVTIRRMVRWTASIAAVGVMFIIASNLLQPTEAIDKSLSFHQPYLIPPEDSGITKMLDEESQERARELYENGLKAFKKPDYNKAILELEAAFNASNKTEENYYELRFLGYAYIKLKKPEKAIEVLEMADKNLVDMVYFEKKKNTIRWYLALAYLENKETNKALPLLDYIANLKKWDFETQENARILYNDLTKK